MTPLDLRDIEKRLQDAPAPPPPEDLLARIQQEIPSADELAEANPNETREPLATPRPFYRRPQWLMAASLLIAASGAFLAYRVRPEAPTLELASTEAVEEDRGGGRRARSPLNESVAVGVESEPEKKEKAKQRVVVPSPKLDPAAGRDQEQFREQLSALGYLDGNSADTRSTTRAASSKLEKTDERAELRTAAPPPAAMMVDDEVAAEATADAIISVQRNLSSGVRRDRLSEEESKQLHTNAPQTSANFLRAHPPVRPVPPPPATAPAGPNDAPYDAVYFKDHGTNPFIDTEDDRLSTFGLDVDSGSYTVARRYLNDGHLPPAEAIRVEEFVNYFDYGDAPPRRGDFALTAEAAPSIYGGGPRHYLVRFNVTAREVSARKRKPATLVFVVDVSGSMAREDRLRLVKQSLLLLLEQLRGDDRVGLVIYGSSAQVLLEPTSDLEAIRDAVARLHPGGSTNVEHGLRTAYGLLDRNRRSGTIHRVILCSDGVAYVGRTSAGSILEQIEKEADGGIELTTVGFGMGNYNDVLMEQLADRGDGSYAYVDTLFEARRIFVEKLTGTLQTVASDAKVQVEFNPEMVSRYRLLGYENRAIADEKFRDDTVDAGEIGAGHTVTALYEIKLAGETPARGQIAKLHLRYRSKRSGDVEEISETLTRREVVAEWEAASPALQLAGLVGEFAESLKGTYWSESPTLGDVFTRAQRISSRFAGDPDIAELVHLIGRASKLTEGRTPTPPED